MQEDTATDIANDAIMDYRDANDTNFDPNVNDAIDFVQESVRILSLTNTLSHSFSL